jgi:hypothetical protein
MSTNDNPRYVTLRAEGPWEGRFATQPMLTAIDATLLAWRRAENGDWTEVRTQLQIAARWLDKAMDEVEAVVNAR